MTLEEQLLEAAQAIIAEFNQLHSKIGNIDALLTFDKTNLVASINEIKEHTHDP